MNPSDVPTAGGKQLVPSLSAVAQDELRLSGNDRYATS
ncbi:MAG: hypothetical protein ACJAZD_001802, partial [Ilumatobacter sp.]